MYVSKNLIAVGAAMVLVACGAQTQKQSPEVFAEDVVSGEAANTNAYVLVKVDEATGVVQTAVTNEDQLASADQSAVAQSEAALFAKSNAVHIVRQDEGQESSTASTYGYGWNNNNCNYGYYYPYATASSSCYYPYYNYGRSYVNYGYVGSYNYNGCNYYRYGRAAYYPSYGNVGYRYRQFDNHNYRYDNRRHRR